MFSRKTASYCAIKGFAVGLKSVRKFVQVSVSLMNWDFVLKVHFSAYFRKLLFRFVASKLQCADLLCSFLSFNRFAIVDRVKQRAWNFKFSLKWYLICRNKHHNCRLSTTKRLMQTPLKGVINLSKGKKCFHERYWKIFIAQFHDSQQTEIRKRSYFSTSRPRLVIFRDTLLEPFPST